MSLYCPEFSDIIGSTFSQRTESGADIKALVFDKRVSSTTDFACTM